MLKINIYIGINAHVTIVTDGQRTECEDRAILKQNSQKELLSGEDIEFICKLLKPYSLDLFF